MFVGKFQNLRNYHFYVEKEQVMDKVQFSVFGISSRISLTFNF